jgi:hypothetical protein
MGIVLFSFIALGGYFFFSGFLGWEQGIAAISAIVLAILVEWLFHKTVRLV